MNNITDFYCGDLKSKPSELKKIDVIEPCTSCTYLDVCGGRCLYANHAKLWPAKGEKLICKTIIHLIETIKNKIPEIKKLIDTAQCTPKCLNSGARPIKESDFKYEKYFGPEIIP